MVAKEIEYVISIGWPFINAEWWWCEFSSSNLDFLLFELWTSIYLATRKCRCNNASIMKNGKQTTMISMLCFNPLLFIARSIVFNSIEFNCIFFIFIYFFFVGSSYSSFFHKLWSRLKYSLWPEWGSNYRTSLRCYGKFTNWTKCFRWLQIFLIIFYLEHDVFFFSFKIQMISTQQ